MLQFKLFLGEIIPLWDFCWFVSLSSQARMLGEYYIPPALVSLVAQADPNLLTLHPPLH